MEAMVEEMRAGGGGDKSFFYAPNYCFRARIGAIFSDLSSSLYTVAARTLLIKIPASRLMQAKIEAGVAVVLPELPTRRSTKMPNPVL